MTGTDWTLTALTVAAFVLGRYLWPSLRSVRDRLAAVEAEADAAYDEGWDDAQAEMWTVQKADLVVAAPVTYEVTGVAVVPPALPAGGGSARDWLTETMEQLSPEHIQDLPGPSQTVPAVQNRAGEPSTYDRPLPTVLNLGQEFAGDDKTAARVHWRGWDLMGRYEREQEAWCREMGIEYRGLVAA